jgi:hypothetical protein
VKDRDAVELPQPSVTLLYERLNATDGDPNERQLDDRKPGTTAGPHYVQ